jgi:hypothetical protein
VSDLSNPRTSTAVGRWFRRARGVLSDLAARHVLRQELLECDRSGVLDSVLADLQMSRGELEPMVENYPLSRRLFGAMAVRLGIDPACDGPLMRRGLQHTCAVCAEQRRCQQWLDAGRTEGYEEFCPNADYWHALKERIRLAAIRH